MPDPQNPNDPTYDWLFTEPPEPAQPGGAEGPDSTADPGGDERDEEITSFGGVYPARPPASAFGGSYPPPAAPSAPPAASDGPEHTRMLPELDAARGAARRPPAAPPPSQPRSSAPPPMRPPKADPGGAGPARPGRTGRRVRWWRWVLALIILWLVFLIAVPLYAWSQVAKVDAEPSGARPAGGPGTTYLLVGSDSREGLTHEQEHQLGTGAASGQRTDTIILLHVSAGGGPNVMLSVPRDSYVEVPGHGMQKINAAYAYGGAKLLVQTIEQATGIHVDDYVEIGFTGVVDVVDAVGGIQVCPETKIDDPKAGNLKMDAGCQRVDGQTALDYTRSRAFPLGDITREKHQREVIAAVGSKAASWQTVVFPWRYWRVMMAGANSVTVGDNVGPLAFAKFAWAMARSNGSGTTRCVVPYSSLGTSTSVGSVVEWNHTKAEAIFKAIQDDDTSSIHCSAQ